MNHEDRKFLDDVIDFDRDIAPYFFVEIVAGVGAGKTRWVENLAKYHRVTDEDGEHQARILFITSRRAKVDETFETYREEGIFSTKVGLGSDLTDAFCDFLTGSEKSAVCTNAFIESYLRKKYDPKEPRTWLWESFDLIVVDEVHSLVLDATYQSAPFHVADLICKCLDERKVQETREFPELYPEIRCKHVIIMTGTPDPLEGVSFNGYRPFRLDYLQECKNVQPKNIFFIEKKDIIGILEDFVVLLGEKAVYFKRRIVFPREFCENSELERQNVVSSFSDKDKRNELKTSDKDSFDRMIETEDMLKTQFEIPKTVEVFISTARYKEGININTPVENMIIETHNQCDAVQMAGRVRNGVDCLYIVVDPQGGSFDDEKYDEEEKDFARSQLEHRDISDDEVYNKMREQHLSSAANEFMQFKLQQSGNRSQDEQRQTKIKVIDYIERKFPYIRYSYLYERFCYYKLKETGNDYVNTAETIWQDYRDDSMKLKELVNNWFPESKVRHYVKSSHQMYEAVLRFWCNWNKTGVKLNTAYTDEEIDDIKAGLNSIYVSYNRGKKPYSNMNPLLKAVGLRNIIWKDCKKHDKKHRMHEFIEKEN